MSCPRFDMPPAPPTRRQDNLMLFRPVGMTPDEPSEIEGWEIDLSSDDLEEDLS